MPGLLVGLGALLLGVGGTVGTWGLTQLFTHSKDLAKTGGAIALGTGLGTNVGAVPAIDGAIHNIDTLIQQAFPSMPNFPDSLESIVAGFLSPLIVGAIAYQIVRDTAIGRVGVGATYGGMMAINLSNALGVAGNDIVGLEALIRNQGVFGLKGFIADGAADGVRYVAGPVKAGLDGLGGLLKSPVDFLTNIPLIGGVAKNYLNIGAAAGIATIGAWSHYLLLGPAVAAYHAVRDIPGKLWDHKSLLAVPAAYLAVKHLTPGMLAAANFNDPSIPVWSDFLGIGAAAYLGYAINKARSVKFAVAAAAGLMASSALETYFGTFSQAANYVSSLAPALAPVKAWIPGFVGAAAGMVAEAYRQSYQAAHKFAVPVKYGLLAGLGYVAASNMAFANPSASLLGAGMGMALGAGVDGLVHLVKSRSHAAPAPAPVPSPALAPALAGTIP